MANEEPKRIFTRAEIEVAIQVTHADGKVVSAIAQDVSMNGVFVKSTPGDKCPAVGDQCEVHIFLPGAEPPIAIHATGVIKRVTSEGYGIEFYKIDEDSLEHLRNLVRYNADHFDQVDQEIEDSIGIRRKSTGQSDF